MSRQKLTVGVAILFAVICVVIGTAVRAQVLGVERVPPRVLSGGDIGFRVEGLRGGRTPVGTLVVRVNGEWVEAEVGSTFGVRPGTK